MTPKSFINQLVLVSIVVGSLLFVLHFVPTISPYQGLSWASCIFFILLSVVMYLSGIKAAKSTNKNHFSRVVIGFIGAKMMLSVLLIFIYNDLVKPTSHHFLVPFFVAYLFYTIFETHFMMKIGQVKSND